MKNRVCVYILLLILLTVFLSGCMADSSEYDGSWTEAVPVDPESPSTLIITGNTVRFDAWGESTAGTFSVEEYPGGCAEYKLVFDDNSTVPAECLLYHTENIDGTSIPVISMTMFEYDGRGLFVFTEFVREEDKALLPDDFESETARQLNGTDGKQL